MRRRHFIHSISLAACLSVKAAELREKQIFIVIDDAGLDHRELQLFLDVPVPMTIAVLPHLKYTKEACISISRDPLKEIILHQPMEAYNASKNPGAGAIYNDTPVEGVRDILDKNMRSVRGAVGINNHMGSRVTENIELISEVLSFSKKHGFFFLDSKTAYNSQVPRVGKKFDMHIEQRDVFLDIQRDRDYVRKMWGSTVAKAKDHGYAIAIGHIWSKETAAAIRDSYQSLMQQGYTFHKISELYR